MLGSQKHTELPQRGCSGKQGRTFSWLRARGEAGRNRNTSLRSAIAKGKGRAHKVILETDRTPVAVLCGWSTCDSKTRPHRTLHPGHSPGREKASPLCHPEANVSSENGCLKIGHRGRGCPVCLERTGKAHFSFQVDSCFG